MFGILGGGMATLPPKSALDQNQIAHPTPWKIKNQELFLDMLLTDTDKQMHEQSSEIITTAPTVA